MTKTLAAVLMLSAGCEGESCREGETRCHGSAVEICDAEDKWSLVAQCGDVVSSEEPVWECCEVLRDADAGVIYACVPASACGLEHER